MLCLNTALAFISHDAFSHMLCSVSFRILRQMKLAWCIGKLEIFLGQNPELHIKIEKVHTNNTNLTQNYKEQRFCVKSHLNRKRKWQNSEAYFFNPFTFIKY